MCRSSAAPRPPVPQPPAGDRTLGTRLLRSLVLCKTQRVWASPLAPRTRYRGCFGAQMSIPRDAALPLCSARAKEQSGPGMFPGPPLCRHVPAWAVGEDDVAVLVVALQEGDASVLLPVPHRLPEDGSLAACGRGRRGPSAWGGETEARRGRSIPPPGSPALTAEVAADHVRDDPVRPHSLRSGCGSTAAPCPLPAPVVRMVARLRAGVGGVGACGEEEEEERQGGGVSRGSPQGWR